MHHSLRGPRQQRGTRGDTEQLTGAHGGGGGTGASVNPILYQWCINHSKRGCSTRCREVTGYMLPRRGRERFSNADGEHVRRVVLFGPSEPRIQLEPSVL